MAVASVDAAVGEAYARGLHKLMAYKDEYESRGCTSTPSSAPESAPSSARARR